MKQLASPPTICFNALMCCALILSKEWRGGVGAVPRLRVKAKSAVREGWRATDSRAAAAMDEADADALEEESQIYDSGLMGAPTSTPNCKTLADLVCALFLFVASGVVRVVWKYQTSLNGREFVSGTAASWPARESPRDLKSLKS